MKGSLYAPTRPCLLSMCSSQLNLICVAQTECSLIGIQVRAHPAVAHALQVRQALVFSQFPAFFKLYATAPNLGSALMDMCFSRVRFAALETVVDAFKGTKVKVLYVATVLGFLVKLDSEAGAKGQSAVVSEDTAVHVAAHSLVGSVMLPGCAKTIHMGRHPAQVRRVIQIHTCIELQVDSRPCILLAYVMYSLFKHNNLNGLVLRVLFELRWPLFSCRVSTNVTVPDLQSDAESAATNTIHWLQSCNAYVVLESGGVYALCYLANMLHICHGSLALFALLSKYNLPLTWWTEVQCLALQFTTYITL